MHLTMSFFLGRLFRQPTVSLLYVDPLFVLISSDNIQTAISYSLGPAFGKVAAVLICLVVAGSLLGNSFVAGRMAVAAANMNWFPRLFSVVGRVGVGSTHRDGDESSDDNSKP